MSAVTADELKKLIIVIAGPRSAHDTKETWLRGAWRQIHAINSSIGERTIKAIFYGEKRRFDTSLARAIQEACSRKINPRNIDKRFVNVSPEIKQLRAEIAALALRIQAIHSDFIDPLV